MEKNKINKPKRYPNNGGKEKEIYINLPKIGETEIRTHKLSTIHFYKDLRIKVRRRGLYINRVHKMQCCREKFGNINLPETEKASKQVFSLPIYPTVTEEQINFIEEAVLSHL